MSAVINNPPIDLRPMNACDLVQIIKIDEEVYPFPWNENIFRDCLHVGYCCWVFEEDDEIIAYGVMSIGAANEAHILNIGVKPQAQRRGLGGSMLDYLLELALEHHASTVFLEVRPSNMAALNLYDKRGFNQVGMRHNYYPLKKGREDALILAIELPVLKI